MLACIPACVDASPAFVSPQTSADLGPVSASVATSSDVDIDHASPSACGNPAVDTAALPVAVELAFPNLQIARPIVMCDAGDGSNRFFIASQYGVIHYIDPANADVDQAEVFLDISEAVSYKDRENEEGLLGLTFHPKFKDNGYLYLYYTSSATPHLSVVSRFEVDKTDPNRVDPTSEVKILEIPQPAWNHNGGTIEFGPDGMLYIALGDGGAANDLFKNGQNLSTLLGSILRIDVDKTEGDKQYAVPADNPFIRTLDAKPEIYAYGLRNVWRFSFDKKTGLLWAADVGQDLWEEINIIRSGGNYGWNKREGMHPFGPQGEPASAKYVEPVWEYHHEIGKSITGGLVSRDPQLPQMDGVYLYADYVSGKLWGLRYDATQEKVTEHYSIELPANVPVITFGQDHNGRVYFSDPSGHIYAFAKTSS